ncbi:MAG: HEAT repeat domain-containing protein [bacterium]
MGDGIQKKFALIVNGDTEERHLANVEQAMKALKAEGAYEISVASPKAPAAMADSFALPDAGSLKGLINGLQSKMDDDDLLVVYVTGHGGKGAQEEGCADLSSGCYSLSDFSAELKKLPYGKRLVVMDQCLAGASLPLFADSKSTVITLGSPKEVVSCDSFAPFFWSDQVPDFNKDGVKTVEERYRYAIQTGKPLSTPQYYSSLKPVAFSGKEEVTPPFKPEVVEAHHGDELEKELQKLQPGQLALVTFSADWCKPCKDYKPVFDKLAKEYGGRFLMIRAEGVKGSEEDWNKYGVKAYPTVAFIDSRGRVTITSQGGDPNPLSSLVIASMVNAQDQIRFSLERLENGSREEKRAAMRRLGSLGKEAAPAIPSLVRLMSDSDTEVRVYSTGAVAAIAEAGTEEAASAVADLIKSLHDPDDGVRFMAVHALGSIGPKAAQAAPELDKLFKSDDIKPERFRASLIRSGNPDNEKTKEIAEELSIEFGIAILEASEKIGVKITFPAPPPPITQKNETPLPFYNRFEILSGLKYDVGNQARGEFGFSFQPLSWLSLEASLATNFSSNASGGLDVGFRFRPSEAFSIQPSLGFKLGKVWDDVSQAGRLVEKVTLNGLVPSINPEFRFILQPTKLFGLYLAPGFKYEWRGMTDTKPTALISGDSPNPNRVFATLSLGAFFSLWPNQ